MATRLYEIHIEHETAHRLLVTVDPAAATRIGQVEGVLRVTRRSASQFVVELDRRYVAAEVEAEMRAAAEGRRAAAVSL